MAVDLDDLIGSMNQVHAGDRGQGIEEMRRNLRATLGSEAMGPPAVVGSSSRQSSLNDRRRKTTTPRGSGGNANGYIAAGYSERDHWQQEQQQQQQQQQQYQPSPSAQMQSVNGHYNSNFTHWPSRNAMDSSNGYHPHHQHSQHSQHYLHSPPSSWQDPNGCNSMSSNGMMACSLGSSGSWNTGASSSSASASASASGSSFAGSSTGGSSGFNLVLAPANTPQQTPDHHGAGAGGMAMSGVTHGHDAAAAGLPYGGGVHEQRFDCTVSNASTPRKLVGGFNPA